MTHTASPDEAVIQPCRSELQLPAHTVEKLVRLPE